MAAVVATQYRGVTWYCPQLPPSPAQAMAEVAAHIDAWPKETGFESMAVVGSSLGGFYATWVAQHRQCKAVLLNPAVYPARDLAKYIGEQTTWHDPSETFFFKPEYIDELRALELGKTARPKDHLALIAKGDEVLSWQEMSARYEGSNIQLIEGGDHALSDFDLYLPEILAFLDLAA